MLYSDFIQLGAELGIIGFLLYLGIFILVIYYVIYLIKQKDKKLIKKHFFSYFTALGVYSVDANLNFPIARPQVLVIWTLILRSLLLNTKNFKIKIKESNTVK